MPQTTYLRLSDRHPYEVYLLVIILISSVPASLGLSRAPASIRVQLDPTAARVWSLTLTIGAALALTGLLWKRPKGALSVTALLLEQFGLTIAGSATIFYAAVVTITSGTDAAVGIGTVLAFGAASFRQAWKIQRVIRILRQAADQ